MLTMPNGLKQLRERRGWTLERAGQAMGLSESGYKKIERGERKLSQARIAKAREVFDATADEVAGDAPILAREPKPPAAPPAPDVAARAILAPLLRGLFQGLGLESGLARELASAVIASAYNPTALRSPPPEEDSIETGRGLSALFAPTTRR